MPLTEPDLWISHIRLFNKTHFMRIMYKNCGVFVVVVVDNALNIGQNLSSSSSVFGFVCLAIYVANGVFLYSNFLSLYNFRLLHNTENVRSILTLTFSTTLLSFLCSLFSLTTNLLSNQTFRLCILLQTSFGSSFVLL